MTKAIVLGGSRGIGKAISDSLKTIDIDVLATSQKDIDTSNLNSVKEFLKINNETNILILNTGGPKPKPFSIVTEEDWSKYNNRLFLRLVTMLQNIKVNDHQVNIKIKDNDLSIEETGKIQLEKDFDEIDYSISKIDDKINFDSNIKISELKIKNQKNIQKNIKTFFPDIKETVNLKDHQVNIKFKDNDLSSKGMGKIQL